MILQFGFQAQIDNLMTLVCARNIALARSLTSLFALQKAYRTVIQEIQGRTPGGKPGHIEIITDFQKAKQLRPFFNNDSLLDDKQQRQVMEEKHDPQAKSKKQLIKRAIAELALYSPVHKVLLDTIITEIFIMPSTVAQAGSTSQAIGVIWANPKTSYTLHDVIEILVHEITHHTLFIDEMKYTHYVYESIIDKTYWAKSAILKITRPLDKVLHSVVVATEILLFRQNFLGHPVQPKVHPPTPMMLKQLSESISSTEQILFFKQKNKNIFKERAYEIFNQVKLKQKELLQLLSLSNR